MRSLNRRVLKTVLEREDRLCELQSTIVSGRVSKLMTGVLGESGKCSRRYQSVLTIPWELAGLSPLATGQPG